jgi:DNA-binding NarL/FixJ family response regulator
MPTHCASRKRGENSHILLIDPKKLRQAGIVRLLDAWAGTMGLTVRAVELASPIESLPTASCAMIILSVGAASIEDSQQRTLIKAVRKSMPRTPLVVLSDREEPNEVCSAFEAGAAGFMPTSIDPSVALEALSFIKSGGSFFPPSALHRQQMPIAATVAAQVAVEAPDQTDDRSLRLCPRLSAKQEEVLRLLKHGQSNKEIANRLGLSEATIKVHLRCIMRKLGVANRTQVAIASMNLS